MCCILNFSEEDTSVILSKHRNIKQTHGNMNDVSELCVINIFNIAITIVKPNRMVFGSVYHIWDRLQPNMIPLSQHMKRRDGFEVLAHLSLVLTCHRYRR